MTRSGAGPPRRRPPNRKARGIAVVGDNSLPYVQLYYAAPRSGRVLALVNQRLSPAEQADVIAVSEPRVLFGDAEYLDALPGITDRVPSLEAVVSFGSPQWAEAVGHQPFAGPEADPGDAAWLVFTSGSTGTPQGVLHSHRSLLAAARGSVEGRQVPEHGVYAFPFPMCHIAGANILVQHATGSAVVLATGSPTGGENVSSREVEDALSTHPDVDMVAVVGVPDEYWGEAICAVVVPRAGRSPAPENLVAHARESISPFKRPRHVLFTATLPMTTNGKVAKDQVRAFAREQASRGA